MDRLKEIEIRMADIKVELEKDDCQNVAELSAEIDSLVEERKAIQKAKAEDEKAVELRKVAKAIEDGKIETRKVEEAKEMEKYTISSPEYRSAWAKTLMGLELSEVEQRAIGDAITTTATTFVASGADTQGINNGGLLIPTEVRMDILKKVEKVSPFYRDITKIAVASNIDFPYEVASDDASWVAETSSSTNAGIEFGSLKLTGHDLAKNIEVTWKLEAMTTDDFISFITDSLAKKVGKALVRGIIYGSGTNMATGAVNGVNIDETATNPIAAIVLGLKSLGEDFRIGAKAYVSTEANIDIVGYEDGNGNYPYLQGLSKSALLDIEVEPFLEGKDIIIGNPDNYILNEVEKMSIIREPKTSVRRNVYAGYMVADGKPIPGAFAYVGYTPVV